MAKIKEHYLGNMSQHEIDEYLFNKEVRDMEYEEWLSGEGYVSFVNEELLDLKPIHSTTDVKDAINYGVSSINLPIEEVGVDVYIKLLQEKVLEHLNEVK